MTRRRIRGDQRLRHGAPAQRAVGRTDFSDPDAVKALAASWSELRENLGHHAMHEDEIMFPLLRERAPGEPRDPYGWEGEVDGLYDDHARIQRLEAEMDELLARIEQTPEPGTRRLLGREFHRSIQRYTAMCLLHFDDEERRFMSRVWALYDDEELASSIGSWLPSVARNASTGWPT